MSSTEVFCYGWSFSYRWVQRWFCNLRWYVRFEPKSIHTLFLKWRRHADFDFLKKLQSYFGLPKTTLANNSNTNPCYNQTLKGVGKKYRELARFDMSYDEFKDFCREYWEGWWRFWCKCLYIDRSRKKSEWVFGFCKESKKTVSTSNKAFSLLQRRPFAVENSL